MPNAVIFDIKSWSSDDTSRQSLITTTPSFTSELYTRQSFLIDTNEIETIDCGKKLIYLVASYPIDYKLDSSSYMRGTIILFTFNDETHTLLVRGVTDNTKIIYISVD